MSFENVKLNRRWTKLLIAALCLIAVVGVLYLPAIAAPGGERLRNLAGSFRIGFASVNDFWNLSDAATYQETARTEFNILTPENAMKWDALHPQQNTYSFTQADQHVQFAQQNNMAVHGHTLVWHSQNPSWLTGRSWTASELTAVLNNHIDTVLGHYQGQVLVWDVVNEAFNEDGSFRTSLWFNTLGQQYVELAFRRARAADPGAKLIYNDYNVETINSKSTAMYNLVVDLRNRGVPIDGVGLQMHLTNGGLNYQSLADNMQRFAALGLEIYITEMDVRFPTPISQTDLNNQATIYRNVIDRCLAQPACKALQMWGFTDKYSWAPNSFPGQGDALIFDANYNAKPAYFALQSELGGSPTPAPSVTPTPTQPSGGNNTGWVSPSGQAAQSGGDGNGFQTSPTSAFADGGTAIATDTNSGTNTNTSCTNTGKDRHAYFNYPLSIPAGSSITGIEVRLDARADSATGTRQMCVEVSWNNGTTWTAVKTSAALSTTEASYILGSASDTWGRTWSASELTSANFRVRITNVSNSTSRDFFLDWAPVRVTYTGGGGVTNTPTPTACPSATPEPFLVEPVTSPTNQLSQVVTVRIGNGEAVTVTTQSGTFAVVGNFSTSNPALVNVALLPNTTHNLTVFARVRTIPGGCAYGGYTRSTTFDRNGAPLTIVQQGNPVTGTPTPTPTRTATPTVTGSPTPTSPPGSVKVQLVSGGSDNTQQSAFRFRVLNTGSSAQTNLSTRVYFTLDGSQPASKYVLEKYWDQSLAATISGPTLAAGSTYYFTVSYGTAALAAGGSWELQTALHLNDWSSNYSGTNDWWHTTGTLPTAYTDWTRLPAYVSGALVWGSTP